MLNFCSHTKEDERDVMASNVNNNICSSNANSPSDLSTIKPLITRTIQQDISQKYIGLRVNYPFVMQHINET
jgi:hypothetical protein